MLRPESNGKGASNEERLAQDHALLATALAAGFATGSADAAGMDSFTDPAHDGDHRALDITRVSVASDDDGRIAFDIGISNYMLLPADGALVIYIDSDSSAATGSMGDDFAIRLSNGTATTIDHDLGRWTGTKWDFSVPKSSLTSSFLHGARVTVDRKELGNTERFNYSLGTFFYPETGEVLSDYAPESGSRPFDLKLPAAPSTHTGHTTPTPTPTPTPSAGAAAPAHSHPATAPTTPAQPSASAPTSKGGSSGSPIGAKSGPGAGPPAASKAVLTVTKLQTTGRVVRRGKVFGVGIKLKHATGQPVTRGQITCVANVRGRSIKLASKFFDSGMAICGWKVPRAARGRLSGSIRVSVGSASVTKRFTAAVR